MGQQTLIDIDEDRCNTVLEESAGAHSALMTESRGNAQTVHNLTRLSGLKKYDEVDPLEAAAAEVIMRIKPGT